MAEEVKRDPRLTLVDTRHASIFWVEFADQWDPKSVWADKRVRLAVNYALDRQVINYDFRALHGVGPRVAEHTINAIPMHPLPSYEDMRLKGQ